MLHTDKTKTVQELFAKGYSIESILFDRIDWKLLKKQKHTLLNLIDYFEDKNELNTSTHLQGILHVIDLFQDAAVDSGYAQEKVVFAESKFEVTVQAVITKTFYVQASCKEEAEEIARQRFSTESQELVDQDVEEDYEYTCLRVEEWSCDEALLDDKNV